MEIRQLADKNHELLKANSKKQKPNLPKVRLANCEALHILGFLGCLLEVAYGNSSIS